MKFSPNVPKPYVLLLPLVGMGLFVLLYVLAALKYPGGSWMMPQQNGFSFWNNYLCDLLDKNAINGELNTARYLARTSLTVLCLSLFLIWYNLPSLFKGENFNISIMWLSGMAALITTAFLSSGTHDNTVRIAGFFAVIAFLTCFLELFKAGYLKLFIFGAVCLIIFLFNYYIYETGQFIRLLPIIQKITFVCFIIWFIVLDILLYQNLKWKTTAGDV
ncbi:MAG: hypothetical protein KJP26_10555 [Maribacter sp.]|nr:hypothetical protein [Maribacter sp.]